MQRVYSAVLSISATVLLGVLWCTAGAGELLAKAPLIKAAEPVAEAREQVADQSTAGAHVAAAGKPVVEARAESAFGLATYQQLAESTPDDNIFISPYSLYSCLHLAYNGAAKQTASEMARVLGLEGVKPNDTNKDHKGLTEQLTAGGESQESSFVFHTANSLWANAKIKLKPEFVALSKNFFGAQVQNLNFSDSDKAADAVNSWVSRETHGKIDRIVGQLSDQDLLLLVNAAYFKARWQSPFAKNATTVADFHVSAKTVKKVSLMHISNRFNYLEKKDLQAIELPYSDGDTGMYIFLPREKTSLANFTHSLSCRSWDHWISQMAEQRGELELPSFTMNYQISCKKTLSALGMKQPFSAQADFSGMLTPPPSAAISDVLHKTFVKLDEDGTEAAAATAVIERSLGMPQFADAKPFKMVVDHPFFFAVMNKKNHALLFVGQVTDPSGS